MRSKVGVPPRRMRDGLRHVIFVFALCVAPFTQAGSAAAADGDPQAVESAIRRTPAPSVRQMLGMATNSNIADLSQTNLHRQLDSATGARVPRGLAALQTAVDSPTANTSSSDEIFPDGFDRLCRALGNSCGSAGDCCSATCSGNTCINASGTLGCRADSDLCSAASDCCSGHCDLGASGGSCVPLSDFGVGVCAVDGEPCSASDACCSHVCASVPGGGMACQAPSGCNVTHDLCTTNAACCGSAGSYGAGATAVNCSITAGMNAGLCSNPSGCKPNGSLCGGTSGSDCCSGNPNNVDSCGPDLIGVNRCRSPACISSGQACASSADCCNSVPCVPDAGGTLSCAVASCMPSTAACTTNADCCSGLQCAIAPGALGGTCMN